MELGTLLAQLEAEGDALMALQALGDLVLLAEVTAAGERFDEAPSAYVSNAVRRFALRAADADWLGLVGAIERTADPAAAALRHMLRWALDRDACDGTSQAPCACGGIGGGGHARA